MPLLPLLLCTALLHAQTQEINNYGKTADEIIAMGEQKWHDFYISKAGDSTPSEEAAYTLFATLQGAKNDELAKKDGKTAQLAKLRKLLTDYGVDSISIGSDITEGGTIWNIISSQLTADVERVSYDYLEHKQASGPKYVVSSVQKQLEAVGKEIEAHHSDPATKKDFDYKTAKMAYKSLQKDFRKIVQFATTLDRADSDRILGFCSDYGKDARGEGL